MEGDVIRNAFSPCKFMPKRLGVITDFFPTAFSTQFQPDESNMVTARCREDVGEPSNEALLWLFLSDRWQSSGTPACLPRETRRQRGTIIDLRERAIRKIGLHFEPFRPLCFEARLGFLVTFSKGKDLLRGRLQVGPLGIRSLQLLQKSKIEDIRAVRRSHWGGSLERGADADERLRLLTAFVSAVATPRAHARMSFTKPPFPVPTRHQVRTASTVAFNELETLEGRRKAPS